MTAKINNSAWVAFSMMTPEAAGRIAVYCEKKYIGRPYSKTAMITGKKIIINEGFTVDLSLDEGYLYINPKGEIPITKVDKQAAEGTFSSPISEAVPKKKKMLTIYFFAYYLLKIIDTIFFVARTIIKY